MTGKGWIRVRKARKIRARDLEKLLSIVMESSSVEIVLWDGRVVRGKTIRSTGRRPDVEDSNDVLTDIEVLKPFVERMLNKRRSFTTETGVDDLVHRLEWTIEGATPAVLSDLMSVEHAAMVEPTMLRQMFSNMNFDELQRALSSVIAQFPDGSVPPALKIGDVVFATEASPAVGMGRMRFWETESGRVLLEVNLGADTSSA